VAIQPFVNDGSQDQNRVATFPSSSLYMSGESHCPDEMTANDKQAFVTALVRDHGQRLRRFLASRLRHGTDDIPDLVQEVYLRLLRIPHQETIRSPQAYMFTVAMHVLHQHRLRQAVMPEAIDPVALIAELDASSDDNPASRFEVLERLGHLDRTLRELPPKAYATFVLHRRYGFSLEEIGEQLGVSRAMVKKHLARAVAHCRERVEGIK
jgi:RNA polymerase sigma factor (sigma-70 family)